MENTFKKVGEKIRKGLTFSKMFRVKQEDKKGLDKKGLTFGGIWK